MAQFRTLIRTDLDRTVTQYRFGGKMFTQDNKANRIDVALYKNNVEIEAEGTVVGIAKRNDNKAIAFPGGIENGRPYIELPEAAYDVEGPLSILIRLTDGEEKTVIGVCDAYVTKTADTDYVTSGHIIVSIQEMTEKLDELEPLLTRLETLNIENVEAIADMVEDTQTALNTVNDIIGNSFMAYVEDDTLVIDPVDPTVTAWATVGNPTDEQVDDAVTDWLDDHPEATTTIEDGSVTYAKLDSNLKEKADDVGDLKSAIDVVADANPSVALSFISGSIGSNGDASTTNTRIRTATTSMPQINPGDYVYVDSTYKAVIRLYNSQAIGSSAYYGAAGGEAVYKNGVISLNEYAGKYANIVIQKVGSESSDISADIQTVQNHIKYVSLNVSIIEIIERVVSAKLFARAKALNKLISKAAYAEILTTEYNNFLSAYGLDLMDGDTVSKRLSVSTSSMEYSTSQYSYGVAIPISGSTKYVIRKNASNAFRVSTSVAEPANGGTVTVTVANHDGTEIEITSGANDAWMLIIYGSKNSTYTEEVLETVYESIVAVEA